MANYFVDSVTGDDGDTGLTMDLAWASLEYALESGGLAFGDYVWVRRTYVEPGPGNNYLQPTYDGTKDGLISLVGWPRPADATADGASWTNGSATVDLVTTLSMDREKHQGRYVDAPDGKRYMITRVVDSNTFVIDNEYTGTSVTTTDGAFTIQEDPEYDTAQAINDSGWTIDKAVWNADAVDIATVDWGGNAYGFIPSGRVRWYIANLEFTNTVYSNGVFAMSSNCALFKLHGCLFKNTANGTVVAHLGGSGIFERCVIEGSGAGSSQRGFLSNASIKLINVAIYNCGKYGMYLSGTTETYLSNVNVGVEIANGDADIMYVGQPSYVYGVNVKLGATNGDFVMNYPNDTLRVALENYGKVLGAHKQFTSQGSITKVDVVTGSGDPYKRTGGADSVMEVLYDKQTLAWSMPEPNHPDLTTPIFVHEFEATTDTKNYRYYVQSEGIVTAAQIWIEVEYISQYEDGTEYVVTRVQSDEALTARADAEDWEEYLEVTDITPAVASKVRITCKSNYYHASNKIYIDPKVVITDG